MNHNDHTPEQLAQWGDNVGNPEMDNVIRTFLRERTSKDIEMFSDKLSIHQSNKQWIEPAKLALQLKRAEETANQMTAQMDRLIQHTEKLTTQTDTQIQNLLTLSNQTTILINESKSLTKYTKGLYCLTIAILASAVIQLYLDWHTHN